MSFSNKYVSNIPKELNNFGTETFQAEFSNEFYSLFRKLSKENGDLQQLADKLVEELEKSLDKWDREADDIIRKGSLMNLYTAYSSVHKFIKLIQTIATLYFVKQDYQSAYMFLQDYLQALCELKNGNKLTKYFSAYKNIWAEYQQILRLYFGACVKLLAEQKVKNPQDLKIELAKVQTALANNYAYEKGKIDLLYNEVKPNPDIDVYVHLLEAVAELNIGNNKQGRNSLLNALKCDFEFGLTRKLWSGYQVTKERKFSVINDYNLAVFEESNWTLKNRELNSVNEGADNPNIYEDLTSG